MEALLMIHGHCATVDYYAISDEQTAEIYGLAWEAFFDDDIRAQRWLRRRTSKLTCTAGDAPRAQPVNGLPRRRV